MRSAEYVSVGLGKRHSELLSLPHSISVSVGVGLCLL